MAQYCLDGHARCNRKYPLYFHTSHPQLCNYLRHSKKWVQVSAVLYGGNKVKSNRSLNASAKKKNKKGIGGAGGFGGHFRAVQGFKYIGEAGTA